MSIMTVIFHHFTKLCDQPGKSLVQKIRERNNA